MRGDREQQHEKGMRRKRDPEEDREGITPQCKGRKRAAREIATCTDMALSPQTDPASFFPINERVFSF